MKTRRRLLYIAAFMCAVFIAGILGFYFIGRAIGLNPTLLECLYHTVITLATVGNRTPEISGQWYGQAFIIALVLVGMVSFFLLGTNMTAFLVEGELRQIFRRKRMDKILAELRGHFIVCGAGDTGAYVIEELVTAGHAVVIVDAQEESILHIIQQHPDRQIPYVVGPAADDEILYRAGLQHALGVIVALPDDRDNLFVTFTTKQVNPKARIVARGNDAQDELRLRRAGADAVVNTARIGGMRLASELARPQVTTFLDNMLRGQEKIMRIEEIEIDLRSQMAGRALRDTNLRSNELLVLAIRDRNGSHFLYNPPPETILEENTTLIVLGPVESVKRFPPNNSGDTR